MKSLIELSASSDLLSLQNPTTSDLFLYVMQNAFGLVKIGRSDNPQRRVLEVQKVTRCAVALIAAFPKSGHFEEWIHIQMAEHRVALEWFEGTESARALLSSLLGKELCWAYGLEKIGADAWIERLLDSAADRYWRRRERDMIRRLKGAVVGAGMHRVDVNGSAYLDSRIALHVGFRGLFWTSRNGKPVTLTRFGNSEEMIEVPPFTRSMEAALQLWLPNHDHSARPLAERAVECCLFALCDRLGFDSERLSVY